MRKSNHYIKNVLGVMVMMSLILGVIRWMGECDTEMRSDRLEQKKENGKERQSGKIENKNIRVLLMTTGYKESHHASVEISAEGGLILEAGKEEWIEPDILKLQADDERFENGKIRIQPLHPGEQLRLNSIQRGYGIPDYEGILEIWSGEEGMVIINELPMETYLRRVVPSEMPSSYHLEALKAQAVCARSYACRQMEGYSYPEYQAHVDDSTEFQVYNNSMPSEKAEQAVTQTAGQVVWYEGRIATTYYFSTSCGKTTDIGAWGKKPGKETGYLETVSVSKDGIDYEKEIPWYKWKATISEEKMTQLMEEEELQVGNVKAVEAVKRGAGGVVVELNVIGDKGTEVIRTENKIRRVLGGVGYQIERQDGTMVESGELLPSAFFALKKDGGNYILDGGGYGHGIGMSQNGANEMAKSGMDYREILSFFYKNIMVE